MSGICIKHPKTLEIVAFGNCIKYLMKVNMLKEGGGEEGRTQQEENK